MDDTDQSNLWWGFVVRGPQYAVTFLPSLPPPLFPSLLNICCNIAESAHINVQLHGFSQNSNSHVTNTKIKKHTSTPESPFRFPLVTTPPPGITIIRTSGHRFDMGGCRGLASCGMFSVVPSAFQFWTWAECGVWGSCCFDLAGDCSLEWLCPQSCVGLSKGTRPFAWTQERVGFMEDVDPDPELQLA